MAYAAGMAIYNITTIIQKDIYTDLEEEEKVLRVIGNLALGINIPFTYYFAAISVCLISRLVYILEFNESIGPLFRILQKSSKVFLSFLIVYISLVLFLGLVGNISFLGSDEKYRDLFTSVLTIIDASMGSFDLNNDERRNKLVSE